MNREGVIIIYAESSLKTMNSRLIEEVALKEGLKLYDLELCLC